MNIINKKGVFCGLLIPLFLKYVGFYIGKEGIDYYSEIHMTELNSYMHTFFMPMSMYGFALFFPKLFYINNIDIIEFQKFLYCFYMTHYMCINIYIGLLVSMFYYPVICYANKFYLENNRNGFLKGVFYCFVGLAIQEYFGHYLSGDPPSRLEAIPNAILYAKYYSIYHIFY